MNLFCLTECLTPPRYFDINIKITEWDFFKQKISPNRTEVYIKVRIVRTDFPMVLVERIELSWL